MYSNKSTKLILIHSLINSIDFLPLLHSAAIAYLICGIGIQSEVVVSDSYFFTSICLRMLLFVKIIAILFCKYVCIDIFQYEFFISFIPSCAQWSMALNS